MSQLRLGACVVYEGDHASRTSGKNSAYEVTLRNSATGVPVIMVSARNVAEKASAISCPLHTSVGCDSSVNFNCTPIESIRESFDNLCKPMLQAIVSGDEPLGTIVVDCAGAARNRIATSLLEQILGFFAACSTSSSLSSSSQERQHSPPPSSSSPSAAAARAHHLQHANNSNNPFINTIERAHASLVELDSRGELVDILDPSSPHTPRIDENFDAQSVHVSNATLLDIVPRTNRAKVARSAIAGRHAVCTVFLRRKVDGSLASLTVVLLQALGDGLKSTQTTHNGIGISSSSNVAAGSKKGFRATLRQVCDGLVSDPMPPTLPFSKSNLTFLLKGALCQTHPSAWIIGLSPWYETGEDKESFADAVAVMKSARVVASLTDLSTRSLTSPGSPLLNRVASQSQSTAAAPSLSRSPVRSRNHHQIPPTKTSGQPNNNSNNNNNDNDNRKKKKTKGTLSNFYDDDVNSSLSPQTPPPTAKRTVSSHHPEAVSPNRFLSHYHIVQSNPTSPAPQENSCAAIPQPLPKVVAAASGDNNEFSSSFSNNVTAVTQLVQQVRQLESLVSTLQSSLKKTQDENQQLRMHTLTIGTQLGDASTTAARCENIVNALRQYGKFSATTNETMTTTALVPQLQQQQQQQQPSRSNSVNNNNNNNSNITDYNNNNNNNFNNVINAGVSSSSSSSQRRRMLHRLLSPAIELPAASNSVVVATTLENRVSPGRSRSASQQQQRQDDSINNISSTFTLRESGGVDDEQQPANSTAANDDPLITSEIWSRRRSEPRYSQSQFPNYHNQHALIPLEHAQQQAAPSLLSRVHHRRTTSADANQVVVVGYNFDLTEEDELAVRKEMEKRGIKV